MCETSPPSQDLLPVIETRSTVQHPAMVLVARRSGSAPMAAFRPIQTEEPRRSSVQLPMGDGRESPLRWLQPALSWSPRSRETKKSNSRRQWLVKLVYIAAAVSWVAHFSNSGRLRQMRADLTDELFWQEIQLSESLSTSSSMKKEMIETRRSVTKLKKTKQHLEHEARIVDDFEESGKGMWTPPRGKEGLAKRWVEQRVNVLKSKIDQLTRYIRLKSRKTVQDSYGPGPYRVKFNVEFNHPRQKSVNQSFVVETAPLEQMPHAVHMFLDMVDKKLWDDTMFVHNENIEHVIAAAPIDYKTHLIKFGDLHLLGWDALGFPEYSASHPHAKYTLGFADRGPTFYINTIDNIEAHGPGGQGHHTLPDDGDPCFATVVEGTEVIDSLIQFGIYHNRMDDAASHPWATDDHSWTHLISLELL